MKDLNSVNKYICNSCNKEIDFIWSSGINNSNPKQDSVMNVSSK